jgi:predicted pyridoxine 5'-phosphate oxidase superfamily flavin-nucleotide-binding protein
MNDKIAAPFHAGELRAQELAGGGPAGTGIRAWMPDQHRSFFAQLPFLIIGVNDADGWPIASFLHGSPGFAMAPGPNTLVLTTLPHASDPARAGLHPGAAIGVLGIELPTRRRNRANGSIARRDEAGLVIDVTESFGNCPKYITPRTPTDTPRASETVTELTHLGARAIEIIGQSDTMFVASSGARHGGNDVSHRGGAISIEGGVLTIPDLPGNRYFNTLGNLLVEPRCALLFIDFTSGDVLQLQGRAEVRWQDEPRSWRFHLVRGWLRAAAFPFSA